MNNILARLCPLAVAAAFCGALPLQAAPLFSRTEGSLSADLPAPSRGARVRIDRQALTSLHAGEAVTIDIPGVGRFEFLTAQVAPSGEVLLIQGTLKSDPVYRIVLGVREEGVSGVISTPAGVFALGYVNGEQWLSTAGAADRVLLAQGQESPLVIRERVASAREKAPVKGAQPVDLNLAQLADMQPGEEALLTLPDTGSLRVTYEETRPNTDSASWVGYLKDFGKDYRIILTYSPLGTTGHILTPQGELSIESTPAGQTYLIDPRKLGLSRKEGDESCEVATPPVAAGGAGPQAGAGAAAGTASAPLTAAATPDGTTVVDVLVVYSASFVSDKGSVAQAETAVDHLVSITNQAYIDSGVPLRIRKVGTQQVSVADSTSNSSVLTALTNGTGAFSGIRDRRNALGADLVSIVRPFHEQTHGGCGVAWVGGYNGGDITGSSGYAYSVVSEGRDRAGSGWYCDITSFAHELGHNQGLMHDRATVSRQGGGQGATPYAFGYGLDGVFGTVMSYIWPKVGKFSNPNDRTCGGSQPCGVAASDTARSADNARALDFTRVGVASYRTASITDPPPTGSVKITGLLTLYGKPRATIKVSGAGATCVTGSNAVYQCTVASGWTGTLTPSWVKNGRPATFSPRTRSYTNLTTNQVNQNFSGNW